MRRGSFPWMVLAAVAAAVLVAIWLGDRRIDLPSTGDVPPREPRPQKVAGDPAPASRLPHSELRTPRAAGALTESAPDLGGEVDGTWETVEMDEVRAAMPENLYWKFAVPSADPRVAEEREAERDRWNVEYGKMLSGTGTEDEIRAYYDFRARLSTDYVELTTYLLDHYRDDLPERDVALLELARRLHLKRLEEVPRKIEEAFERKRQQDAAREAWLADEKAFADPGSQDGAPP
jgi:hypothetical protein